MEVLRPMDDADQPEVSGQRIKALYEVIRESHAIFDSTLVELELDPPIACKSGCIHCCYNQVALTEPEALFLGLHLLETRDRQNLQDLKARTLSLVNSLKGKSWQAIGLERHRLPCLFLEDGNCSIYPARPLACRGWNSVDEEMCRRSNQSENAMTLIENHPAQRLIADSIQRGLLDGSKELGLEAGFMLMARAVLLFLGDDAENRLFDCTGDWLSGRPFFNRKRD
jgi:Fe-S-cluster containining protein